MQKYIAHLRSKPHKERQHILHLAAFGITLVIALIWIATLGVHLTKSVTAAPNPNTESAFTTIKDNLVEVYADAQAKNDALKKAAVPSIQ